eukprot:7386816-Prymnesium_polylepis.1
MSDPVSIDAVVELIGAMNGPNPDFIMRNGGWLITSRWDLRCSEIKCLGFSCKRQPVDLVADEVEITVQDS